MNLQSLCALLLLLAGSAWAESSQSPIVPINLATVGQADSLNEAQIKKIKPYMVLGDYLPSQLHDVIGGLSEDLSGRLNIVFDRYSQSGLTDGVFEKAIEALLPNLTPTLRTKRVNDLGRSWVRMRIQYAFTEHSKYLKDPRQPVEVSFKHFGSFKDPLNKNISAETPEAAEATLRFYKAHGFKIKEEFIDLSEFEKEIDLIQPHTEDTILRLSYVKNASEVDGVNPGALPPIENPEAFRARVKNLTSGLKHAIGLVRGFSLAQFRLASLRSPTEKKYEALAAGVVTVFGIWGTQHALQKGIQHGEILNAWLPLLIVAADKFFYTYYQRAVSATFGQGKNYNFTRDPNNPMDPQFVSNAKFFLMASFANSVILRMAQTMGAHIHVDLQDAVLFNTITLALLQGSVASSVRGIFSKGPLQFWIQKFQDTFAHDPRRQIIALSVWNGIWGIGQVFDVYDYHLGTLDLPGLGVTTIGFRTIMSLMAGTGAFIMVKKDWKSIRRMFRVEDSKMKCQSLLQFK